MLSDRTDEIDNWVKYSWTLRILLFFAISIQPIVSVAQTPGSYDQAMANGRAANEAFRRSHQYLLGWLTKADSATGLIPRNLTHSTCIWNAWDAAADNYPFMVMTSSM